MSISRGVVIHGRQNQMQVLNSDVGRQAAGIDRANLADHGAERGQRIRRELSPGRGSLVSILRNRVRNFWWATGIPINGLYRSSLGSTQAAWA